MSIRKRGDKYWIDFRYQRTRYRYASPMNTKAGAQEYEALVRGKLAKGESLVVKAEKRTETIPTFEEFSRKWFDSYVKVNNKYSEVLNKEGMLRVHLVPYFGKKRLDQIRTLDIEEYKGKKLQDGQSMKSVNNHLIAFNKCMKTAQDWEVISQIPKAKLLKVPPQTFDFLSIEECSTILNYCEGMLGEMVLFALYTGVRFGELIAISWDDINFGEGIITIQKSITRGQLGSPKSNRIRHIPLHNNITKVLSARTQRTGFIFSKENNQPLNPVLCLNHLHRACKRAELRKIGWHVLRHTFASHLVQNNVSIVAVKELLGHADIKTTMRYSHLNDTVTRDAINTLDQNNGHNMVTILENRVSKPVTFLPSKAELPQKTNKKQAISLLLNL
ncbi:MAG: tyrosine-type recombinase/integrase [Patescibacteria group bacterium]